MQLNKSQLELLSLINEINNRLNSKFDCCEHANNTYQLYFIDNKNNYIIFDLDLKTVSYDGRLSEEQLNKLKYCLKFVTEEMECEETEYNETEYEE